jgi:hypothetical protein
MREHRTEGSEAVEDGEHIVGIVLAQAEVQRLRGFRHVAHPHQVENRTPDMHLHSSTRSPRPSWGYIASRSTYSS